MPIGDPSPARVAAVEQALVDEALQRALALFADR
jgi:hypothetical protein